MVGVPKSRGCSLCRKRKIKCDEARPACSQCIKGNRQCPGYSSRLKFQDEGPQLKKRYSTSTNPSRQQSVSPESEDSSVVLVHSGSSSEPDDNVVLHSNADATPADISALEAALQDIAFFSRVGPITVPQSPETKLAARFLQTIFPALPSGMNLIIFGGFLTQIPQRLGSNRALDDAVECLYIAHQGFLQGQLQTLEQSRRQYGKALRSLQQCITEKDEGVKPETLCATMLLGIYEIFAGTSGNSWVRHAGGCARLIELRGADHYKNPFERELLASQRGPIIIESILMRKDCFLDSEEWQDIFRSARDELPPEHRCYDDLMSEMAKIPRLLRLATSLRQELYPLRQTVMTLRKDVLGVREALVKFEQESLTPNHIRTFEKPSTHPDSPWKTVVHCDNNYIAGLLAVQNSCVILVNCILENLPDPVPSKEQLHEESEMLAVRQMRMWEYAMIHAPFGSMYIWLSMRAAYVVQESLEMKMWVVNRLNEALAALQLSGYEAVTLKSLDYYFGDFMGPVGLHMRDE